MTQTTILELGGLYRATAASAVESTLMRRPGVTDVRANAVSQTATIAYDPTVTSVAELAQWIRDCGYHCAGRSVPNHICDPLAEPLGHDVAAEHSGQACPATTPKSSTDTAHSERSPHDMMGHGGQANMSMDAMVQDMRNRFLVALDFTLGITLWSPMGRDMLGFDVPAPFGPSDGVFALLLSLPSSSTPPGSFSTAPIAL